MKHIILLCACFLLLSKAIQAQSTSDSTKYLLALYKYGYYYNKIIENGKSVMAKDSSGFKLKGKLTILTDSTFLVKNQTNRKTHIFNIHSIEKLRETHKGVFLAGLPLVWFGLNGNSLNTKPGQRTQMKPDLEDKLAVIGIGIGFSIFAELLANGYSYKNKTHYFKIHTAVWYKLKEKQLQQLYPLGKQ